MSYVPVKRPEKIAAPAVSSFFRKPAVKRAAGLPLATSHVTDASSEKHAVAGNVIVTSADDSREVEADRIAEKIVSAEEQNRLMGIATGGLCNQGNKAANATWLCTAERIIGCLAKDKRYLYSVMLPADTIECEQ